MNNTLKKLMMAFALCGALCGTAMATPKGGAPTKGKPPAAQPAKTHAPAKHVAQAPAAKPTAKAPAKPVVQAPARGHGHVEPARPAHRHEVARHAPPPPPKHHEPKHHHDHHGSHHEGTWCVLGASIIGGLVGGLISAAL